MWVNTHTWDFEQFEQYHTSAGTSIWESKICGTWHSWWYKEWHSRHSTSLFLAPTSIPLQITHVRSSSNISSARVLSVWIISGGVSRVGKFTGELFLLDLLECLEEEEEELLLFLLLLLLLWSLSTGSSIIY